MNRERDNAKKRIAIVGCGPAGLFMYKRLTEEGNFYEISVFEKKREPGAGMPYSREGANDEHITNVSDNEIPTIVTSIKEWVQTVPEETLRHYCIDAAHFNEYKVLPRLFFGQYLSAQFDLLHSAATAAGITTQVYTGKSITDIIDRPETNETILVTADGDRLKFDIVIVCTGHSWPVQYEGTVPGYYDSPYPPAKLAMQLNHPVAIKGASLTAIDAIRTLARNNGTFKKNENGKLSFHLSDNSPSFRLIMHSRSGLLPALRFHLEDSHLANDSLLTPDEINTHIASNGGFLSLDYIFEKDFKEIFAAKDPEFYEEIRHMSMEQFVEKMMELRERLDPFVLLKAEYEEAEKSIKRKQSVYWKEMLAVLSFAMNYPAKYFSAEDMQRLQKVLMPLISVVIAFIPQSSCLELLALHAAGVLELVPVGGDSSVEPLQEGGIIYHYTEDESPKAIQYKTFVNCTGQPHLNFEDLPFKSLVKNNTVSPAMLPFKSPQEGEKQFNESNAKVQKIGEAYYLKVPGITINNHFRVADQYGAVNPRIYFMAVPYIGGFNPDYSGLDFCAEASSKICQSVIAGFD